MDVLTVTLPSTMSPVDCVKAMIEAQDRGAVPVIGPPEASARLLTEGLPAVLPPDGEACMVLPTSGTTTAPRSVVRTAASWTSSLTPFTQLSGITGSDVIWAPGTAGSTMALFAAWHAAALDLDVVCSGPWRDVPTAEAGVRRADVVHCVPTVLADIVRARAAGSLPRLRLAVVAGALLPDRVTASARATGLDVVEYYGAAELSFVAAGREALRPFPGVEVAIRDGAVWCRSPYLARAVLGPAAGAYTTDSQGWASVGDRARVDTDGVLHLQGRRAGLLVGGHVILADDVEQVLGGGAGVREVVCLAADDARLGDLVVAVVVPDRRAGVPPGAQPAASTRQADRELVADLRRRARAGLPRPARPLRYVVLDEVPRTPGGKVARAELATGLGLRTPS